jgi:trehalose-6-phosphate synthase
MPLEERRARHQALLAAVSAHDVDRWRCEFLSALQGSDSGMDDVHDRPAMARPPNGRLESLS